jgi:chromosome partitioning protein
MPPNVISFVNSKGGSGKTTLAFSLATYWDAIGKRCVLIDCDSQASLATLVGVREDKGALVTLTVSTEKLQARLRSELKQDDIDFILIDTPGSLSKIRPAIESSNLVVIPTQPSGIDYFSFRRVYNLCDEVKAKTLLVPNRVKSSREIDEIIPTLEALGEKTGVISNPIMDRVSYRSGAVHGLSIYDLNKRGAGSRELISLAKTIEDMLNGKKPKK